MSIKYPLPPFDVVNVVDASHGGANRLRIYVAISPEDLERARHVATQIVEEYGRGLDVVMIYFYPSREAADPPAMKAMLTGQYIRNGFQGEFRPKPITSKSGTFEIEVIDGLLIIEREGYLA